MQIEATEMLRQLSDYERGRYRQLQGLAQEIRHNYNALDSSSQMLLVGARADKLDFLLSFYLRMRSSLCRYDRYFATTRPRADPGAAWPCWSTRWPRRRRACSR